MKRYVAVFEVTQQERIEFAASTDKQAVTVARSIRSVFWGGRESHRHRLVAVNGPDHLVPIWKED